MIRTPRVVAAIPAVVIASTLLLAWSAAFAQPSTDTAPTATASSSPPTDSAAPTATSAPTASASAAPTTSAPPASSAAPKTTPTDKPSGDAAAKTAAPTEPEHEGSFEFGSYGRVVAATDGQGGPGRNADIVLYGSRMDEDNYAELELRREDKWEGTGISTNVVFTLAIASPVFHYNGDFDIAMAARNLYLEAKDIGTEGLDAWVGSRMVRGDDLYLLDHWPLDNLNLLGGGVGYHHPIGTSAKLTVGVTQPDNAFFRQSVLRPAPLSQFGAVPVELLDREKFIGALRLAHNQKFDPDDPTSAGIKAVLYGEGHVLPSGERETKPGVLEQLPSDGGWVIGGQFTAYTGERDTHVHIFARYASGLAAYGQFAGPGQLANDKTASDAHELFIGAGGNVEYEFFGTMLGAYFRNFRDASPTLDFEDVDEGAVVVRPSVWFVDWLGLSLEGTFEMVQRGVITEDPENPDAAPSGPLLASLWRFGVMPFISPGGRGDYTRPHIRFIYNVAFRDLAARSLYAENNPFHDRDIEHFIGLGAEWWFNSSSYGN